MPEASIGLYPDVGSSYFLSRLSGHLGNTILIHLVSCYMTKLSYWVKGQFYPGSFNS